MQDDKEFFYKVMYALCKATKTEADELLLQVYLEELEPIGFDKVNPALYRIYKNSIGKKFMPSPKEIKAECGVFEPDEDQEAIDLWNMIYHAVTKIGDKDPPVNSTRTEARDYLGDFGMEVADKVFGYSAMCNCVDMEQLGYMTQNAVKRIKVYLQKAKAGNADASMRIEGGKAVYDFPTLEVDPKKLKRSDSEN